MISKKKKKGLRQNWDWYFVQFRKFRRLRGGCFRMGGAIFHFSHKIGLKSTKNMRFCILHKSMGGARAPPAYATVDRLDGTTFKLFKVVTLELTPKKFGVKEVAFKKHRKNISDGYIYLKIPFHPYQPTFGRDEFFFFFQHTVRLFPKRHNTEKKLHQIVLSRRTYDLRCTNNANEIRAISPKKLWLFSRAFPKISTNRHACTIV